MGAGMVGIGGGEGVKVMRGEEMEREGEGAAGRGEVMLAHNLA